MRWALVGMVVVCAGGCGAVELGLGACPEVPVRNAWCFGDRATGTLEYEADISEGCWGTEARWGGRQGLMVPSSGVLQFVDLSIDEPTVEVVDGSWGGGVWTASAEKGRGLVASWEAGVLRTRWDDGMEAEVPVEMAAVQKMVAMEDAGGGQAVCLLGSEGVGEVNVRCVHPASGEDVWGPTAVGIAGDDTLGDVRVLRRAQGADWLVVQGYPSFGLHVVRDGATSVTTELSGELVLAADLDEDGNDEVVAVRIDEELEAVAYRWDEEGDTLVEMFRGRGAWAVAGQFDGVGAQDLLVLAPGENSTVPREDSDPVFTEHVSCTRNCMTRTVERGTYDGFAQMQWPDNTAGAAIDCSLSIYPAPRP